MVLQGNVDIGNEHLHTVFFISHNVQAVQGGFQTILIYRKLPTEIQF